MVALIHRFRGRRRRGQAHATWISGKLLSFMVKQAPNASTKAKKQARGDSYTYKVGNLYIFFVAGSSSCQFINMNTKKSQTHMKKGQNTLNNC